MRSRSFDISGGGDLDVLDWLWSDFDSDDVSVADAGSRRVRFMGDGVYWQNDMDEVDI